MGYGGTGGGDPTRICGTEIAYGGTRSSTDTSSDVLRWGICSTEMGMGVQAEVIRAKGSRNAADLIQ
eukprot:168506-Rhodomonas_salina.1